MSLVIGQVAGTLVQSIGLWLVFPFRPRLTIARRELPSMLRFGLGHRRGRRARPGGQELRLPDGGGKLGAAALGVYYLAFRLPELVILTGFRVAGDVLFPFYSRLRGARAEDIDDDLRRGYLETVGSGRWSPGRRRWDGRARRCRWCWCSTASEWRDAAAPMALVAIWAGLASLATMPGAVFKALGRSWLLTATGVMQIAILFPAIWFAAPTASPRWPAPRWRRRHLADAARGDRRPRPRDPLVRDLRGSGAGARAVRRHGSGAIRARGDAAPGRWH